MTAPMLLWVKVEKRAIEFKIVEFALQRVALPPWFGAVAQAVAKNLSYLLKRIESENVCYWAQEPGWAFGLI